MTGTLAWLLGDIACKIFPSGRFHLERIGDWTAMLLFQPVEILLSFILFVTAFLLLLSGISFHFISLFPLRNKANGWLHAFPGLFSLFVMIITFLKMPIASVMMACLVASTGMWRGLFRRRFGKVELDDL